MKDSKVVFACESSLVSIFWKGRSRNGRGGGFKYLECQVRQRDGKRIDKVETRPC